MTDTLEITFIGICTHLWKDQPNAPTNAAWGTRIVMPNVSDPLVVEELNLRYDLDPPVMPHVATLAIPIGQLSAKQGPKGFLPWVGNEGVVLFTFLDGVTVTVANPAPGPLVKNARCLPQLGAWLPDIAPGDAATAKDHESAAAYFDYQSGTLTGMSYTKRGDAGGIVYSTPTTGAAQITITPFDARSDPTTVFLTSGATQAYILNIPAAGDKDNPNDFILHYRVANDYPPPPWPPKNPELNAPCLGHPAGPEILRMFRINDDDFGVGCSNSNLP